MRKRTQSCLLGLLKLMLLTAVSSSDGSAGNFTTVFFLNVDVPPFYQMSLVKGLRRGSEIRDIILNFIQIAV